MISPDTSRRLWSLGLFVLPLLAAKLAAGLMGGTSPQKAGAAPAVAAVDPALASVASASRVVWNDIQRTAASHVRELMSAPFGPSPMVQMPSSKPVESEPVVQPEIIAEAPVFAVHAVMTAPNADKALINGRTYQVDQEIDGTGWLVVNINVDARCVTLRNRNSGEEMVIKVQRPQQ